MKPSDTWTHQNESRPEDERELDTSLVDDALTHHAIALTMANIVRFCAKPSDRGVRLLTQDPHYRDETNDIIKDLGFEVIGGYGAGGFAKIDDECVIFSAFTSAPVKQIITDLARPLVIISCKNYKTGVWNKRGYLIPLLLLLF